MLVFSHFINGIENVDEKAVEGVKEKIKEGKILAGAGLGVGGTILLQNLRKKKKINPIFWDFSFTYTS